MRPAYEKSDFFYRGRLWPLTGGVHPEERKPDIRSQAIIDVGIPATLSVPLRRYKHNLLPCVQLGDEVSKGQVIARDESDVGIVVHSPSSGTVKAITARPLSHVSLMPHDHIVIACDGQDKAIPEQDETNDKNEIEARLKKIKALGITGLGGAGFPSHLKLQISPVKILIINGAECEPYIACDDGLMRESAEEIVEGIALIQELVQAESTLIAIEDNKPEAISAMITALETAELNGKIRADRFKLAVIPSIYPSGGEKQLIEILTGQQVPYQGLPIDMGILMHNVGTCFAVKRALIDNEPFISRVVTVAGEAVTRPGNYRALIGTPIQHLLSLAGLEEEKLDRLIVGGPMMGVNIDDREITISSESNCIIASAKDELAPRETAKPCIRCGDCADVCPASLLPQQLYWYAQSKDFDQAESYDVMDCIECGACAYVCPSSIPLVHHYRFLKSEIREQKAAQEKSQRAKERFEFREQRLAREKAERAERHRKAAEERAARAAEAGTTDANKQAILDAMKRVQAKKNQRDSDHD